ncbi:hypothetical protein SGFS_064970 [Streptomyces graminofaciens]|uniref:Lipoprotein n=1 Tax=Streptomyces graminofaciens TaxID=68212 RepID=A0ABN5VRQ2_9ACTN|nr:hypothetical protein [Streptomyces graminofaciens]BBC35203.1 hypothetical protein SGFS_064970 [Streptomyces graminofaciens]
MRTPPRTRTALASAAALLLALTLTGCGDDEVELPMLRTSEGVADYLNKQVGCTDPDYVESDELPLIKSEVSNAVDGGGECDIDEDSDIFFVHVTDMTKFQQDVAANEENEDDVLMIGMDFALDVDRGSAVQTLLDQGLLFLDCNPGMQTPQQYQRIEAEDDCVLTDYERE